MLLLPTACGWRHWLDGSPGGSLSSLYAVLPLEPANKAMISATLAGWLSLPGLSFAAAAPSLMRAIWCPKR